MLNRRYIRVKVFQALYSYYQAEGKDRDAVEKDLIKSINGIYDLYVYILLLLIEIKDIAKNQIEQGKEKKLPSDEDLNPNTRFIDNRLLKIIEENEEFKRHVNAKKMSWHLEETMLKKILNIIRESDAFGRYMEVGEGGFKEDREFLIGAFRDYIWGFESLHYHIEEKSIYWLDDLAIVNIHIIKTFNQMKQNSQPSDKVLMPLYKDFEDDLKFVKELFRKTIANDSMYEQQIKSAAKNWESDRIVTLDLILMKMGLCEMQNFNSIPIKVSLNEYIELSKDYSTPKSKIFINGILDKLANELKASGEIVKTGRGLVG